MDVISDKRETIFRKDFENRTLYRIGLSKKDENGNYINGYMDVRFRNGVDIPNNTKIEIKKAWIGFGVKDKKTYPYIFINEFETVGEKETTKEDPFAAFGKQIEINEDDIPF